MNSFIALKKHFHEENIAANGSGQSNPSYANDTAERHDKHSASGKVFILFLAAFCVAGLISAVAYGWSTDCPNTQTYISCAV